MTSGSDAADAAMPRAATPVVVAAAPQARRRATWSLLTIPVVITVTALWPAWWTILLAALAISQISAEYRWVTTATLTLDATGVHWHAPWRGYDAAWDDIERWTCRRIGVGGATSSEWLLTVHHAPRWPNRSFLWLSKDQMRELAPAVAAHAGDLGLPEGWPT